MTSCIRGALSSAPVVQRQLSNLSLSATAGEAGQQRSEDAETRSNSSSPGWTSNDQEAPANIDIHEPRAYEPEPLLAEASFTDGIADVRSSRRQIPNGDAQDDHK